MAIQRKKLRKAEKKHLVEEAGDKCANPGCSNWRAHIHHIKRWSVYGSDDTSILIAVCPSCHDAIHHGLIKITDEDLYQWKKIERKPKTSRTHVYIEPSEKIKLLTGTIAVSTTNESVTVFELSDNNQLGFRILDGDIALLNLRISDLDGNEVLRVSDNYIKVYDEDSIQFERVPGHVQVTSNNLDTFISSEFVEKIRIQQPEYPEGGNLTLLEIKVLKPGLARIKGCWADNEHAVIITDSALSFITRCLRQPLSMVGEGENSVLLYGGPINCALFGFKDKDSGALKI